MAFDMYSGDAHEHLDPSEEYLLALAEGDGARFPQLSRIARMFYASPRFSAEEAGAIVHELIELASANGGADNRPLARLVMRLLPFFSRAYRGGTGIQCHGD